MREPRGHGSIVSPFALPARHFVAAIYDTDRSVKTQPGVIISFAGNLERVPCNLLLLDRNTGVRGFRRFRANFPSTRTDEERSPGFAKLNFNGTSSRKSNVSISFAASRTRASLGEFSTRAKTVFLLPCTEIFESFVNSRYYVNVAVLESLSNSLLLDRNNRRAPEETRVEI